MRDRYYGIIADDVINGEGICVSFFTMGCEHHCPGCHNKDSWSTEPNAGKKLPEDYLDQIIALISKNGIQRNFSVLGGEPLLEINRELVLTILKKVKEVYPNINIIHNVACDQNVAKIHFLLIEVKNNYYYYLFLYYFHL